LKYNQKEAERKGAETKVAKLFFDQTWKGHKQKGAKMERGRISFSLTQKEAKMERGIIYKKKKKKGAKCDFMYNSVHDLAKRWIFITVQQECLYHFICVD
jgi:guanylate kinase